MKHLADELINLLFSAHSNQTKALRLKAISLDYASLTKKEKASLDKLMRPYYDTLIIEESFELMALLKDNKLLTDYKFFNIVECL
jgi:hypothetical protein